MFSPCKTQVNACIVIFTSKNELKESSVGDGGVLNNHPRGINEDIWDFILIQ